MQAIVMREMELWRDKIQLRIRDRIQTSVSGSRDFWAARGRVDRGWGLQLAVADGTVHTGMPRD
jgi:hypothetical protein